MSLTIHQQEKLDEGLFILESQNRLVIKGSAGVGKTYLADTLIKELIPTIRSKYKHVLCATPTHKALSVLRNKVTPHDRIVFSTIHSALKLKRNINKRTGTITFKPWFDERFPPLKETAIIIIDEASMLNTELLTILEQYAKRFKVKVIFLGDNKQLNPVGEENSPVFFSDYPEIELTEIVRQGEGNPIIELSRKTTLISNFEANVTSDNKGYTYTHDTNKIVKRLAAINGTDELKYLAWTNAEVDTMNDRVREEIYGTPRKIEVGETLVFNSPYGDEYYTNYELFVEEVKVITIKRPVFVGRILDEDKYDHIEYKVYLINPESEEPVRVIHEDSEKQYQILCAKMKANSIKRFLKWIDYFAFMEYFADLKYNHAITIHKSQGSTYNKTIVNIKNINYNKNQLEKKRLLYTAVTRASDLLILYNV